jgi:hypothetical protein
VARSVTDTHRCLPPHVLTPLSILSLALIDMVIDGLIKSRIKKSLSAGTYCYGAGVTRPNPIFKASRMQVLHNKIK